MQKEFNDFCKEKITEIENTYSDYKTAKNTKLILHFVKKYPFLRRKGRPSLEEILSWQETKAKFNWETQIKPLLQEYIAKITGLYKHGQTEKTGLCNLRILSNIRLGKLSIAISKNTLSAKEQWEGRLIKDLKKEYPGVPLKELILIISSKKTDLDGNATHCKDINAAFAAYTAGKFKIIFICSNNTRINEILTLLNLYEGLAEHKKLKIDIQHDEAHNKEEGVPSKRELIENIIMNPYVEAYVPVTASYDPLIANNTILWKKENLDTYAINYTKNSKTLSTSENYSSISDAHHVYFEDIEQSATYVNHNIQEFDEETFDEADNKDYSGWEHPEEVKEDKKRRRQLEFHTVFMALEKDACNLGMNVIDNNFRVTYRDGESVIETPLILPGQKNIHIITTPLRVVLTLHLMKYAVNKDYNPICIGLYRGAVWLLYKNRFHQRCYSKVTELSDECTTQEMNNKINDILEKLVKEGESIDRPIFIMGNYKPTGESITFVNYKYGTIRSDTLLPISGQTREMSYQGFLRSCYMDTKFRENSPDNTFIHPPKFIIGKRESINHAVSYEKENDERILRLQENSTVELVECPPIVPSGYVKEDNTHISIPMRISIEDTDDPLYKEYRDIINKTKRSEQDKKRILVLIDKLYKNGNATIIDPTGKFNFSTFILKEVRCWKKSSEDEIAIRIKKNGTPFEADYRFREYDSKHKIKMPYINNKGNILTNECEMLGCFDKYEYDGFSNNKSIIWISYRFQ
jgi:hypothetical protein